MTLDKLDAKNLHDRIEVAINIEQQRLQDLFIEYSYWNEAHQNLIIETDPVWANINIGSYLTDTHDIDLSIAVDGSLNPTIAYVNGKQTEIDPSEWIKNGLVSLIPFASTNNIRSQSINYFMEINDQIFMISTGPFLYEESAIPRDDKSFLLFAKELDDDYLEKITTTYILPELSITSKSNQPANHQLSLADLNNQTIAQFTWIHDRPSNTLIPKLALPATIIAVVMLLLTWLTLRYDATLRKHHLDGLLKIASKDFLTGISNRREFFYLAGRELTRANREKQSVCLLIFDIDHFKQINDDYGHSVGDKVLIAITEIVKTNLRDFDIFARWGGEEFTVLLPGVDAIKGMETAERLRTLIKNSVAENIDDYRINCTISTGISIWNNTEDIDSLVSKADLALYCAKQSGRNRSILSE